MNFNTSQLYVRRFFSVHICEYTFEFISLTPFPYISRLIKFRMCDMFQAQVQNEKNIPSTVVPCSTAVTHRRSI